MSSAHPPRPTFLAYDPDDESIPQVIAGIFDRHGDGQLDALEPRAASGGQGDRWLNIERDIRACPRTLAIVDHPNANVAFEFGFALGLGKECYLGQARSAAPPWIEGPPFVGLLRGRTSMRSEIVALLGGPGQVVDTQLAPGEQTLFLCPHENIGEELLAFAASRGWRLPDPTGWNLARMDEVLDGCWRVIWVVLPFDRTADYRHGRANAGYAAVAGFARARGLDLRVLRSETAEAIDDVAVEALPFADFADFQAQLGHVEARDTSGVRAAAIAQRLGAGPLLEHLRRAVEAGRQRDVDATLTRLGMEPGRALERSKIAKLTELLAADDPERERLVDAIVASDHDLAHATILCLRGLEPIEALDLLQRVPLGHDGDDSPWDGDDLATVLVKLRADGADEIGLRDLVLSPICAATPPRELAQRYYGLEAAGIDVDRRTFFERCGRWPAPSRPETVAIPATGDGRATFAMGSPDGAGLANEHPQRQVTLAPFEIAVAPTTRGEYAHFDSTRGSAASDLPVIAVSWWEAWLYARWLGGRLPSEAEWECAARAGTDTSWFHGDDEAGLDAYAWCGFADDHRPRPVRSKRPNPWGLYDMHGNVLEWCQDWYGMYDAEQTSDPAGPSTGEVRVLRGGSTYAPPFVCRSAYRLRYAPWFRYGLVGFRVAFDRP